MPTGYTADITDETTLNDYAWTCALAIDAINETLSLLAVGEAP